MTYEPGFYWVKFNGEWFPAQRDDRGWWIIGYEDSLKTADLDAVGPGITPPGDAA